jgi:hypothetical protein
MLRACAFVNVLDVQLASFTPIKGLHAIVELCPQPTKLINVKQQFLADFVLRRRREVYADPIGGLLPLVIFNRYVLGAVVSED